ncbi:phosphoribosylanthranilate isomerase [Albirhodobacter sp. R86504]|jgi:phosphoribosylanthranilate isomerase|uniref:phosphoribosylanthranilate isomerase n=1 Tax=Albirhodobacter sp. R86504 TaxID=3093848 RepID=UPI00366D83FB
MATRVKICGLRDAASVGAAVDAGARYLGFVFFPKSPRNVTIDEARDLAVDVPMGVAKVALVVNASDAELTAITQSVPLDMLQLHGAETPERVAEIRARFGLPVMKALGVADAADLARVPAYEAVADQLLLDAKAPKGAVLPGGNGLAFDWQLVKGYSFTKPWMLAGGLTPENVAQAVRLTGALQVDVSSGVESSAGVKDHDLIRAFVHAAG